MSTILKALQQLEDEKREKPELTLSQQIAMTQPPKPTRSRSGWVLAVSAAAGIAAAVAAIYFWMAPDSATDAGSQAVAVAPASPASRPVPKPTSPGLSPSAQSGPEVSAEVARSSQASPPTSTPSRTESKVQVVQRLSPTPKIQTESLSAPVSADDPVGRARRRVPTELTAKTRESSSVGNALPGPLAGVASKPAIQRGVPSGERATATKRGTLPKGSGRPERTRSGPTVSARAVPAISTATEPVDAQQPLASPVARAERVKAVKTPPIVSKPATGSAVEPDHTVILRAEIPELKVRSTVWHPLGSRRVAIVEVDADAVLEMNEGDVIGPLVVESIKPGGVVFSHDGVSVLYRVGR